MAYNVKEIAQGIVQFIHDPGYQIGWQFQTGNLQVNGGPLIPALHIQGGGITPTATSGSTTNASINSIIGTDQAGKVLVTNSGTPATGAQAIVVFANAYATAPYVTTQSVIAGSYGMSGSYVTSSTNSFTLFTTLAPVISGTFGFNYMVMG